MLKFADIKFRAGKTPVFEMRRKKHHTYMDTPSKTPLNKKILHTSRNVKNKTNKNPKHKKWHTTFAPKSKTPTPNLGMRLQNKYYICMAHSNINPPPPSTHKRGCPAARHAMPKNQPPNPHAPPQKQKKLQLPPKLQTKNSYTKQQTIITNILYKNFKLK